MALESRAIQRQEPSDHSLFSRARRRPPPSAPTASAPAEEDLPTAGHSQVNSEVSLGRSDSRGISINTVASAPQAGDSADGDGEGHLTDDHTSENRAGVGSNATATDAIMSHGDTSSQGPNATNASADTAAVDVQQAAYTAAVHAAGFAAVGALMAADAAALGERQAAQDEAEAMQMPGDMWQPEVQAHGGQQEQQHHVTWWRRLVRDPFALLMHLLAFTHSPSQLADSDRGASAAAAAAGDRVKVFQASL